MHRINGIYSLFRRFFRNQRRYSKRDLSSNRSNHISETAPLVPLRCLIQTGKQEGIS